LTGSLRCPGGGGRSLRPPSLDSALGHRVERHQEEWFAIHAGVPGAVVHRDRDITWKIESGSVWSNAATALRLEPNNVERRLDGVISEFAAHGRGAGFWVDLDATPIDLEDHLKKRGFRCRKHFPGMACELAVLPEIRNPAGISVRRTVDYSIYKLHPHPVWGWITTPIRRYQLSRVNHLSTTHPDRIFDFVAVADGGRPVGGCTLFLGAWAAGIHDAGVVEEERGKGIGSALIAHVLRFARDHGHKYATLLSSGMGFSIYQRAGFREACRIGYWYRASFQAPDKP